MDTEQHTSPLETPLQKKFHVTSVLPSLYCKTWDIQNSLNMYKPSSHISNQATTTRVWKSFSVCLCKCVNTQNYTAGWRTPCLWVSLSFVPSVLPSSPLLSSLCRICLIISLSWRLLFLLIWRAAMCENPSGSFIWLLIYYIKVQSDIFELYKGGNKKHFDNLLHVLYQRVRPQKQPAVCLRIFQIKTTFLWSTAWRHLFPQT